VPAAARLSLALQTRWGHWFLVFLPFQTSFVLTRKPIGEEFNERGLIGVQQVKMGQA
jgi:hypothetical protein